MKNIKLEKVFADTDVPVYVIHDFVKPYFKNRIIKNLTKEFNLWIHNRTSPMFNNFKIESNNLFFFRLLQYKIFKFLVDQCNVFVAKESYPHVYAYYSTQDHSVSRWHKHEDNINMNSISTVYYLNLSDGPNKIKFIHKGKEYSYQVKEYDFVLFPDSMLHTPDITVGKGKRISINLEIVLNESTSSCIKKLEQYKNS